ncbi:DNA (cytosine-5-)-methyltransferase [Hoylesella saccharolytica F0055]|uniref:Cytosine-specific methyltransferase n=1 Tax=Hoylesella saccharolytica F0055 TaxID=1127699 RepID=L1NC19_9BACT|nr:DNA (cytosine-5-)-methyltransferase [Hoylesella saccharolytica]EKY00805.1 DNA (cytosine-5-)-methyltransferase [Hoylesella saccharolytica F0055]
MEQFFTITSISDILSVSIRTVNTWVKKGIFTLETNNNGEVGFYAHQLLGIPQIEKMINSNWNEEFKVKPVRDFTSIELFAGGGGLALGMEKAGFKHVLLNEFDKAACNTLRHNRPNWNVVEGDIHEISFKDYEGKVDFVSGGFPCQAFSYAGNKAGFEDARGTLFFELARAVKEVKPKVFMGENVKGLYTHDKGHTFEVIKSVIADLGYTLIEPQILKAIQYQVPQKRERLILVAIRNDIADKVTFHYPSPYTRVVNLRDAFFKGVLYDCDVPESIGQQYPQRKKEIMAKVPMGGYWKDLPDDLQREYMKACYFMEGGKTGIARRLSLDEPSLTLTCAPAMKQTERCHPTETRPLTVREYARIQTFPDNWFFCGNLTAQYKQIGNAVPVNLAAAIGRSLIRLFNDIETL